MTRAKHLLGMSLLLACAAPGVAHAQPTPAGAGADPARQHYDEGNRLYDEGRQADAEAAYERAWAIRQSYDVALQLGSAELDQKKYREAAEHLAYAQANVPIGAKEETRKTIGTRLALALGQVGAVRVVVSLPDAEVLLDGAVVGRSPLGRALYVEPGSHTVAARTLSGQRVEQPLEAKAGSEQQVTLALADETAAAEGPSPVVLGVGYGVSAVGIVVGAVLLGLAGGKTSDADALLGNVVAARGAAQPCRTGGADCAELQSLRADSDQLTRAGAWTVISAGVLAGATTAYLLGSLSGSAERNPDVALGGGWLPGGGSAVVSGTW
jgi:hypothetical protein